MIAGKSDTHLYSESVYSRLRDGSTLDHWCQGRVVRWRGHVPVCRTPQLSSGKGGGTRHEIAEISHTVPQHRKLSIASCGLLTDKYHTTCHMSHAHAHAYKDEDSLAIIKS